MAKSYKQLYEETKAMLDKYQNEVVPKLREQTSPITEDEIEALKMVAHGCNSNTKLRGHNEYVDALVKVYELIERLKG